ncbi:NAD(P)-binding domain-containing protein [Chryseobacterium polytrichastri]|uniref:NAD dependent epimerase/dehydratase family enzyme n=1 Tax=Chryseobacterium polytrichastri TaxID=1302687 RepID=A0A1M6ZST2_9FLAO|nr:NAD(P)-binding domain-containing protein [Chryseobacterium polytrichastri]SHL33490.1 NAD dependent epimerase/dehydratase family enzyme [Chryseobacterium polytrichastri]
MKKIGIIGCGWLGDHIAERLSGQYEIFTTTTSPSKIEDLTSKGYHTTLVDFPDEHLETMKEWEVARQLDAVIITVPFAGVRGAEIPLQEKAQNLLTFLGDYKGQLYLMSSTGVYPQAEKEFTEDDKSVDDIPSERVIKNKFPQVNILRLAGLMGDQRLLKNYNISNLDLLVNHIHYADICSVVEKMLNNESHSKVYNVVAPVHPNKEEIINAQKDLPYSGERTTQGRTISPAKLISELGFEFEYPDPRYFHL